MYLTFLIPCYRSEKTLASVVQEVISVVSQRPEYQYEIILINDCSPDNVFSVQKELAARDRRIKIIHLTKNVGKAAAVLAGMAKMSGDAAVLLDDDGQCPVDRLWDLVEKIEAGYDMAVADYPKEKQNFIKSFGSKINNRLMRFLIGQPDHIKFSNFNIRKRFICDQMVKYNHPYPNLQGLTLTATHNIAMVPMEERERKSGASGYTFWKSFKLLINGCTGFSVKPLRLASILGVLFSIFGMIYACVIVLRKIINPNILVGYTSTIAAIFLVGGIIMALLGIIGEYLGRIYICINQTPQYVIREEVGFTEEGVRDEIRG